VALVPFGCHGADLVAPCREILKLRPRLSRHHPLHPRLDYLLSVEPSSDEGVLSVGDVSPYLLSASRIRGPRAASTAATATTHPRSHHWMSTSQESAGVGMEAGPPLPRGSLDSLEPMCRRVTPNDIHIDSLDGVPCTATVTVYDNTNLSQVTSHTHAMVSTSQPHPRRAPVTPGWLSRHTLHPKPPTLNPTATVSISLTPSSVRDAHTS
jgi:hypothetical protein